MAKQPSLGSEIKAMTREAVKDIRNTMHQFFFGRGEGEKEMGAPLQPTAQELTMSREVVDNFNARLDMQVHGVHGPEQEKGIER